MGFIYLLTNEVNGKSYVGQTIESLATRWRKHRSDAKHDSRTHFNNAIRKYGPASFNIQILSDAVPEIELDNLEKIWIILLQTTNRDCGYNQNSGGNARRVTFEGIEKMRRSLTGRHLSESHKQNIIRAVQQRWADSQYKEKTGAAISASLIGRVLSEEHCQHISVSKKGKPWTIARWEAQKRRNSL